MSTTPGGAGACEHDPEPAKWSLNALKLELQTLWRIARSYPSTWLAPLLVLILCCGLGIFGVQRMSQISVDSTKAKASSIASTTAAALEQRFWTAAAPLQLLSSMVRFAPHWGDAQQLFLGVGPSLLAQEATQSILCLELSPAGITRTTVPHIPSSIGYNMLLASWPTPDRRPYLSAAKWRRPAVVGPVTKANGAVVAWVATPVFANSSSEQELFGITGNLTNSACGDLCAYNATGQERWWGFVSAAMDVAALTLGRDSPLSQLHDLGYHYRLVAPVAAADGGLQVVAGSGLGAEPHDPVVSAVQITRSTQWTLYLAPEDGTWTPAWFGGVVAVVVVMSLVVAGLLFALLISRHKQRMLLEALLPKQVIAEMQTDAKHITEMAAAPRLNTADTPAGMLLNLLGDLLEGQPPDVRDVVFLRSAILRSADLYTPMDFKTQLKGANLDVDVMHALMRQLGAADDRRFLTAGSRPGGGGGGGGSVRPNHHNRSSGLSHAGTSLDAAATPYGPIVSVQTSGLIVNVAGVGGGGGGVGGSAHTVAAAAAAGSRLSADDTAATCSTTRYSHAGGQTTTGPSSTGELAFSRFSRVTDSGFNGTNGANGTGGTVVAVNGTGGLSCSVGPGAGAGGVGLLGLPRSSFDTLSGALAVLLAPAPLLFPPASSARQGEVFLPHLGSCQQLSFNDASGCWHGAAAGAAAGASAGAPAAASALLPLPPVQALDPLASCVSGVMSNSALLLPPRFEAGRVSATGAFPAGAHEALLASAALPDGGGSGGGYQHLGPLPPATASCSPLPSGVLNVAPHSSSLLHHSGHMAHLMTAHEVADRALAGGGSVAGGGVGLEGVRAGSAGVPPLVRFGSTSHGLLPSHGSVPSNLAGSAGPGAWTPSRVGHAPGRPPARRVSGSLIMLDGMRRVTSNGGFCGSDGLIMSPQPAGGSQRCTPTLVGGTSAAVTASAAAVAAPPPASSAGNGAVGSGWKGLLNLLGVAGGTEGSTGGGGGGSRRGSTGAVIASTASACAPPAADSPTPTTLTTAVPVSTVAATGMSRFRQQGTGPTATVAVTCSAGLPGVSQPQGLSSAVDSATSAAAPPFSASPQPLQGGQRASGPHRPSSHLQAQMLEQAGGQLSGGGGRRILQQPVAAATLLPPPPIIEEVERVLSRADNWYFDSWRLAEVSQGHALSSLGFYLIHREGLIDKFRLKPIVLARLLRTIEAGYSPDNPYHNATHAADVLQTLHVLIHGAKLHSGYLDRLGLLAAYFAAMVHDHGHPGLTNDFLIATGDALAVRYNDRSPLENHHAASAFALLQRHDLDLLGHLPQPDRAAFRKQVIEMVVGTDMKQHFTILSHFNTAHRLPSYTAQSPAPAAASSNNSTGDAPEPSPPSELAPAAVSVAVSMSAGPGAPVSTAPPPAGTAPEPLDEAERLLTLQVALKAADIGHLGEELGVHERWLGVLEEEFFRQGDKERALGLPISPLFDRAKQGVSKSQVGFYDFVALPLVHALAAAFPGARPLLTAFRRNYSHWRSVEAAANNPSR